MKPLTLALLTVGLSTAACRGQINGGGVLELEGGTAGGTGGGGGVVNTSALADAGLPCAAAELLAAACVNCHSDPTTSYAPFPLVSLNDLTKASPTHPGESIGQRSSVRMHSASRPMPPQPYALAAPALVTAFDDWLDAGMPVGSCATVGSAFDGGGTGVPPWDGGTTCASGASAPRPVDGNDHESPTMAPGMACIACHAGQNFQNQNPGGRMDAPEELFQFMGTVFTGFHEADLCKPELTPPLFVDILDKNGVVAVTLGVNSAGNFYGDAPATVALPYTARVRRGTNLADGRVMSTPQTDGDCNACHTEGGIKNAPGRIVEP